ncbi:unnamed protein product [Caenorhabditis brenneri]
MKKVVWSAIYEVNIRSCSFLKTNLLNTPSTQELKNKINKKCQSPSLSVRWALSQSSPIKQQFLAIFPDV